MQMWYHDGGVTLEPGGSTVNVMRYTVIDEEGTVSFVAHCEALRALVAGCVTCPTRLEQLLEHTRQHDSRLIDYVSCGLAVFDEHNTPGNYEAIRSALAHLPPHEVPVFRVVDDETRQASLSPVKAGVVLFNLRARRIVQIQNTYADISRHTPKALVKRLQMSGWSLQPGGWA